MKKLFTLTIIFLFFFQPKINAQTAFPGTDSLINYLSGNWKWYRSCGGVNGGCTYATGLSTQQFIFTRITGVTDSIAYKYYKNGALTGQGHSKLFYNSSMFGVTWNMSQVQNFSNNMVAIPTAKADSVTFADNCTDCYTHIFARGGAAPTVGLSELSSNASELSIFPNPASGHVKIATSNASEITSVAIYDLTGKRIEPVFIKSELIDLSNLSPGIYLLEVRTATGSYRKKIVKE
jgi:hypothetical protein